MTNAILIYLHLGIPNIRLRRGLGFFFSCSFQQNLPRGWKTVEYLERRSIWHVSCVICHVSCVCHLNYERQERQGIVILMMFHFLSFPFPFHRYPSPFHFPYKVFQGGYSSSYIRKCASTNSLGLMNLIKREMSSHPGQYLISQVQRVSANGTYTLKVILIK